MIFNFYSLKNINIPQPIVKQANNFLKLLLFISKASLVVKYEKIVNNNAKYNPAFISTYPFL